MPEKLVLACETSDNWKTCSWKRNGIKSICRFTYVSDNVYVWKVKKDGCEKEYGSPRFRPDSSSNTFQNRVCQISISDPQFLSYPMIGEWKCELEMCNLEENGGCKTESNASAIEIGKIIVEVNIYEITKRA